MERAPQRLKRRGEFLHVARAGRKWAAPGLVLQVLKRRKSGDRPAGASPDAGPDTEDVRVGFTVTRRVGGAVERNRARRRLRAAVERVMPTHAAFCRDYVVIGRGETLRRPFEALVGDLETALRKLGAWRETDTGPGGRERDDA
jgi:ribonuclease P protein component